MTVLIPFLGFEVEGWLAVKTTLDLLVRESIRNLSRFLVEFWSRRGAIHYKLTPICRVGSFKRSFQDWSLKDPFKPHPEPSQQKHGMVNSCQAPLHPTPERLPCSKTGNWKFKKFIRRRQLSLKWDFKSIHPSAHEHFPIMKRSSLNRGINMFCDYYFFFHRNEKSNKAKQGKAINVEIP